MTNPFILLLGGGYTLSRVAALLEPQSFVITSTSQEKCNVYRNQGYRSERVDISQLEDIERLFEQYPSIHTIADSIPPLEGTARGVENICSLASQYPIQRVLYLSTTGVFGVRDGSWVNEDSPLSATDKRSLARIECENTYRRYFPFSTNYRIAAIYGEDRGLKQSLIEGTYRLPEHERWSNRIHVEDLAELIYRGILSEENLPMNFCLADDHPAPVWEVVSYYCDRYKIPFPEKISEEEALRRGMSHFLSNQRVCNTNVKKFFQYIFIHPSYR